MSIFTSALLSCLALLSTPLSASEGQWLELDLPTDAPDSWTLELPWQGELIKVALERSPVRSATFKLRESDGAGGLRSVEPQPAATYHGAVVGALHRGAAVAFVDGRLEGFVQGADGAEIWIERRRADGPVPVEERHWVHVGVTGGFSLADCAALPAPDAIESMEQDVGGSARLGAGCLWVAELAFDTDHEYYSLHGSTAACEQHIEAVLNAVNFGYARDARIRHEISEIIVRASEPDPYSTSGTSGLLDDFVNHWQSQQTSVQRDMAHLMTARPLSDNVIGLAYVGVVCSQSWGFGWTWGQNGLSSETSILGHELGHNWSAPHCLDTDFCVWMCGGCHQFGPITTALIMDYAAGRACLDTGAGLSTPMAPTAMSDEVVGGDLVIDVLENDHDGNCDSLTVSSFESPTTVGAVVTLSPGTGEGGGDELIFTPPLGWEGIETFTYAAMDATGLTDGAEVTVVVQDDLPEITTLLRLDETSGINLTDAGPGATNGVLVGGPVLGQAGAGSRMGSSILFDGVDDFGQFSGPRRTDGLRMSFSVSAWVLPSGAAGAQAIFGSTGSWTVGLNGLHPMIERTQGANTSASASLQAGQWAHLVCTFEAGAQVRFYLDGVQVASSSAGPPTGPASDHWCLGAKGGSEDFFDGQLDDVHVYDAALTATQVAYLYANPSNVLVACQNPVSYCTGAPNSVSAQGAGLGWIGTPSVWADDFTLFAHSVPSGQFGIFYYGTNQVMVPFGDGFRCVGAGLLGTYRLPVKQADSLGDIYCPLDFNSPPANAGPGMIVDGMEWNFQFWYRDPPGINATFNLTNALTVEFCP